MNIEAEVLIGFGYKKRVGKDTTADVLVRDYGFTKMSFAEPLKNLCACIQASSGGIEDLGPTSHRDNDLAVSIHNWFETNCNTCAAERMTNFLMPALIVQLTQDPDLFDLDDSGKPRKLLQFIGTDCMREISEDFWVNFLFDKELPQHTAITDVRFPNELKAIKAKGGVTVLVNRVTGLSDTHSSETALDGASWDYIIDNNGSFDDLEAQVTDLMEEIHDAAD